MRKMAVIVISALAWLGCSTQGEENKGPAPPALLPPPDDWTVVEKGIDAVPESDAIQLDWLPPEGQEVAGYRLYRRAGQSGSFLLQKSFKALDTTFVDADVKPEVRYFYFMTAIDQGGREGPPSDTVDYMLVPKAFNLHCTATLTPVFRWHINTYPSQYVLKLFDLSEESKVWFSAVQSDFADLDEEVAYNWDSTAVTPMLSAGRTYRWRVDVVGTERNSGSESRWSRFTPGQ